MTKTQGRRSFIKRVQQGQINQPTQLQFSPEVWSSEFSKCADPTLAETRLYEAGIWFHEKLESLRLQLNNVPDLPLGREKVIRATVGALNAIVITGTRDILDRLSEISSEQDPNDQEGVFLGNTPAAIDYLAETVVSTARFPLARAANAAYNQPAKSTATDRDILAYLERLRELGVLYDALENLWAECLWNGWYLETRGALTLITPNDWERETVKALGIFRRQNLMLELAAYSTYTWNALPLLVRVEMSQRPRVVGIRRIGKEKRFEIGPASPNPDTPPQDIVARLAAEELYFNEMLTAPLPKLHGLTIRQLTEAWSVLASVSLTQSARFPTSVDIKSLGRLLEYAPVFSRLSLAKLLVELVGVDRSTAESILGIFIFDGTPRGDLWLTPLVSVDEDNLAIVAPALEGPNLIRSVEFWMKQGGLSLETRGELFEHFVRLSLIRDNKLTNTKVFASAIKVEADGIVEEIDLVAVIGRTILVCELKCSVFPSMPREFHNYFMTLEAAVDQIQRKHRFLESKLPAFLNALALDGGEYRILPAVVSNLPIGAGMPIKGVPITDYYILSRYLSEPKLDIFPKFALNEPIEVTRSLHFYDESGAAETNIQQYLLAPPQVHLYLPFVDPSLKMLYSVVGEVEAVAYIDVAVNMPATVGPPDIHSGPDTGQVGEQLESVLPKPD